jgi:hypothetical protein
MHHHWSNWQVAGWEKVRVEAGQGAWEAVGREMEDLHA